MPTSYVYSTATNDTVYREYETQGSGGLPVASRSVLIKGGSNLASKQLITSIGVATRVSEEDAEFLKKNPAFQRHVKNGFMTLKTTKTDPEKVATDMTTRDKSAPLVPGDFKDDKAPKVGAAA